MHNEAIFYDTFNTSSFISAFYGYRYLVNAYNAVFVLLLKDAKNYNFNNAEVVSDENVKSDLLSKSIFAVAKSGTISLEICNAGVASIIIYKMNSINFFITKLLVNTKFANIINIINNKEIIPELLQSECNPEEIFRSVVYFLKNPNLINQQIADCKKTLEEIKSKTSSTDEASSILAQNLVS